MAATMNKPAALGFRHEALFYESPADFRTATASFIRDGLATDEAVLVVLAPQKIQTLRDELGSDSARVRFADMADVGKNPARIIPEWQDFVAEQPKGNRGFRGIGEPIWAERSSDELVECERHEALLNVAFDGEPAWRLLCPYDVDSLDAGTLQRARLNHPVEHRNGTARTSEAYAGLPALARPLDDPLPPPQAPVVALAFSGVQLAAVREWAERFAVSHAFGHRSEDVKLVAQELASNSVRHGGGAGTMRAWVQGSSLILEVQDEGVITDPLAGRRRPGHGVDGYGLWFINQLADLTQIRSLEGGTIIRVHFR
jgi:anti-sigma regulatory factor (Ser/Thr protein kinase)